MQITSPFGQALRHWRQRRGLSQLDLSGTAVTTTRHLSYLETGRSRPTRQMVERLAGALDVPLRERNRLLQLAGLPAVYPEGDLSADDLAPFRRAVDRLLRSHEPYPGIVMDRHWNVLAANTGARVLVPEDGPSNAVRLAVGPWRPVIDNWVEVTQALLERLERDLVRHPDDEVLRELHAHVEHALGGRRVVTGPPSGRVVCPRFRIGDRVVRTMTVVATFESAADVTLDEVRVELVYPEDDEAEQFFRSVAA
jgi:transcriptional regulator with XRE-family HTH domain